MQNKILTFTQSLSLCMLIIATGSVVAGDDPSIRGQQRTAIKSAMNSHISNTLVGGKFVIFDAQSGELMRLQFKELHKGVVKKGDFFVSCADFEDKKGKLYDLDFLVTPLGNDNYQVIQSLVHAVDGDKRPYHIES